MPYDEREGARKRREANKRRAIEFLGGCCSRCKQFFSDLEVYDFHHKEEGSKNHSLANIWSHSWRNIVRELRKCVLLCANCHRILHKEKRKDDSTD